MIEVTVSTCPSEIQLKQLLDQTLSITDFEHIEAHIESCPICKARLDQLTQFAGDAWLSIAGQSLPDDGNIPEPNRITIPGYELLEIIGSGVHSVVFKAKDCDLKRFVALKLFHAHPAKTSEEDRIRFRQEAMLLAKLNHPNIVSLFKAGEVNGRPFLVTELIDGGTLSQLIKDGIPSERTSARLLRDIAGGIEFAHQHGIIHRDLKPGNVLITKTTTSVTGSESVEDTALRPKVADFGFAKLLTEDGSRTVTGTAFGTPAYLAPELAVTGAKSATVASDIYSIGVIGYELLTGHPPFRGATHFETLRLACETDPVPPRLVRPSLPRDFETVVIKCLEKDPQRRYVSALELLEDLERFLNDRPVLARPLGFFGTMARRVRQHPRVSGLLFAFIALLIGSIIGLSVLYRRAEVNAELATQRLQRTREALLTVTKAREQQFWFPQSVEKKDEEPLRKLYELHAEALPDYRNNPDAWRDTAYALLQISDMLGKISMSDDVKSKAERGYISLQELVKLYPSEPEYQASYAESCMQLSSYLDRKTHIARIMQLQLEAYSITSELIRKYPKNIKFLVIHASFGRTMGHFSLVEKQLDKAEEYLVDSILLLKRLVINGPSHFERREYLISSIGYYLMILLDLYHDSSSYLKILEDCHSLCIDNRIVAPKRIHGWLYELHYKFKLAIVLNYLGRINETKKAISDAYNLFQQCERNFPDYAPVGYSFLNLRFQDVFFTLQVDPDAAEKMIATFHEQARLYQSTYPNEPLFDGLPALAMACLPSSNPALFNPQKALKIIRENIANNRRTSQTDEWLGIILCQSGQYDEAIRVLEATIEKRGEHTEGHLLLELFRLKAYWLKGEKEKAHKEFHALSEKLRNDFLADFFEHYIHDELWKMFEGTQPPARPYPQPKPTGIPLLLRRTSP